MTWTPTILEGPNTAEPGKYSAAREKAGPNGLIMPSSGHVLEDLLGRYLNADMVYLRGQKVNDRWTPVRDVTIRRILAEDTGRQGISVVAAEDVVIEDVVLGSIHGVPRSGIDLEPAGAGASIRNLTFRRVAFGDVENFGIAAGGWASLPVENIVIEDFVSLPGTSLGNLLFSAVNPSGGGPGPRSITLRRGNVQVRGSAWSPPKFIDEQGVTVALHGASNGYPVQAWNSTIVIEDVWVNDAPLSPGACHWWWQDSLGNNRGTPFVPRHTDGFDPERDIALPSMLVEEPEPEPEPPEPVPPDPTPWDVRAALAAIEARLTAHDKHLHDHDVGLWKFGERLWNVEQQLGIEIGPDA